LAKGETSISSIAATGTRRIRLPSSDRRRSSGRWAFPDRGRSMRWHSAVRCAPVRDHKPVDPSPLLFNTSLSSGAFSQFECAIHLGIGAHQRRGMRLFDDVFEVPAYKSPRRVRSPICSSMLIAALPGCWRGNASHSRYNAGAWTPSMSATAIRASSQGSSP